ncbi:MAG TPA: 3-mercaptopyruvate sulfurtransferase [Pseudorhodoplanes sp.]|jgi:thiosulfate/3-mercaptopyruvate sulfurtransferase|nr:3-mercaptopyruvate sulfurtransferase [Pseudorhodoplanes sp.]
MTNERPPSSPLLVTTEWLANHLEAPDIIVVDGSFYLPTMKRDARTEYLEGHIPGSIFFDIDGISDHSSSLPHMLPSPEAFSSAMRQLGIGDGMSIVVYDGLGLYGAARVWWTFKVFGVREVLILDGGLPKWKAEGRPLEFGEVRRTPRHFTARFDRSAVAGVEDVRQALASKSAQVVDARAADRFTGKAPEPRPGLRCGHMPGALNLPFSRLIEDGRLVEPARIAKAFADAGVDLDRPVITSCGSGVTAAILTFALEAIGRNRGRLYDGSWAEWGARQDLPVVTD